MFPLDSIDMDKFIFNESNQTWENYLSDIKKLLIQPCIPCITTNDTIFEEKNNKKEKYDLNINNMSSYEEKYEGFFSDNDDENYNDYLK